MTATEILRRLLDEQGLEWREHEAPATDCIAFFDGNGWHDCWESADGEVNVTFSMTPEQAIAATLGSSNCTNDERTNGTCHDVCNGVAEFTCSACGFNCDLTSWISLFDGDDGRHRHHHHGTPNYCPNCGRKVVDA